MLEVTSCTLTTLNKRDKKTRMVGHIRKLQFDFVIAKNITCTPGLKNLYARITTMLARGKKSNATRLWVAFVV